MKRFLITFVLTGIMILSACSSANESEENQSDTETADEQVEVKETNDPLEAVQNDEIEYYDGEEVTHYTVEDKEGNTVTAKTNGYEIEFGIIATETASGERLIHLVGEQKNDNADAGEMNINEFTLETSEGEKLKDGFGYDGVGSGNKGKVDIQYDLDFDIPKEIDMNFKAVIETIDEDAQEFDYHDVDEEYTFVKQ